MKGSALLLLSLLLLAVLSALAIQVTQLVKTAAWRPTASLPSFGEKPVKV